jgi:hypothetical protein
MISDRQNECLRAVADLAAQCASWTNYAAYCSDRERGLRRRAFEQLDVFLAASESWSFRDRKEFVDWVCQRRFDYRDAESYGLTPTPLVEKLVIPTLNEWKRNVPADAAPHRWLGLFFADVPHSVLRAGLCEVSDDAYLHLRAALVRDATDQLVRVRIVELLIGAAEYSCHHLPHFYIGDPAEDIARLAEAREHITHVRDPDQKARLQSEFDYVSRLIDDWIAFGNSGDTDFDEWCAERGRQYRWVRAYYYSK